MEAFDWLILISSLSTLPRESGNASQPRGSPILRHNVNVDLWESLAFVLGSKGGLLGSAVNTIMLGVEVCISFAN